MPDIDLDFPNRDEVLKLFKHIPASRIEDGKLVKHNSGVYMHNVPVDPVAGTCRHTFNSTESEEYFKLDFLNFGLYDGIKSEMPEALRKNKKVFEKYLKMLD